MPPEQYLRKQCLELAVREGLSARETLRIAYDYETFIRYGSFTARTETPAEPAE